MSIKNVVLIGAGGNIGRYILASLEKAGLNVTVLARKSTQSTLTGHKIVSVSDDYPHAELVAAFQGQDAVISPVTLTPGGKLDGSVQLKFIDAAIEAGVQRYIPSEFGGDHRNANCVELAPLLAEKLKTFKYLESKAGKIEYTVVITGSFYDFDLMIGFTGIDLKSNKATVLNGGDFKFSSATREQVGEGVAAILKHDKETANQFVVLESFNTSQNENIAAVESVIGKKITTEPEDAEKLIADSWAGYKAGNLYAMYGLVKAGTLLPGYGADGSVEGEKWRGILGLEKLDLKEETAKTLAALRVHA